MTSLKDELKELELIQKELEQARANLSNLEVAEQVTLQMIKELKEEKLIKGIRGTDLRIEEDDLYEDYYEDR